MLLCEYSRIAAPFEHMFGIPTLGLDNERVLDYARVEQAWEKIMRSNPGTPAFFATPFQREPISERFAFKPVSSMRYSGRQLGGGKDVTPENFAEFITLIYENKINSTD